jgi:homocitrate synthase NifV
MSTPTSQPGRFELVDTTLRDGEQCPGVVFTLQQRLAIAGSLVDAGVDEIEAGIPAMGEDERDAIRAVAKVASLRRTTAWCRAKAHEIESAASCGVNAVHLSFPFSPILLQALGKCHSWLMDELQSLVPLAKWHFDFVSVGVQDAARSNLADLIEFAQAAENLGVSRLRLADSVGIWNPASVKRVYRAIKRKAPRLTLGAHMHNDLGMATANSLSALQAGASSADVTVLGIGERAGNAPLEQLAMAARFSNLSCAIRPERLPALARLVAASAKIPISPHQPVVGNAIFDHESGIHVQAILRDPRSYEPFAPQSVGQLNRRLLVGRHSGSFALRHALHEMGVECDDDAIDAILPRIRQFASNKRGVLTPDELREIVHQCIDQEKPVASPAAMAHNP